MRVAWAGYLVGIALAGGGGPEGSGTAKRLPGLTPRGTITVISWLVFGARTRK